MTLKQQIAALRKLRKGYTDEADLEVFDCVMRSLYRLNAKQQQPHKHQRYKEFVQLYDDFCLHQINAHARMDGKEGKALNKLIDYLKENSKTKTEQGAIDALRYIFTNWRLLPPFLQRQITLTQINKNLPEILNAFRNYGQRQQTPADNALEKLRSRARLRGHEGGHAGGGTG